VFDKRQSLLFLRIFLPLGTLLLIALALYGQSELSHERSRLQSQETLNLSLGSSAITGKVEDLSRDLQFLSSQSSLQAAVEQPSAENLARLAQDWKDFSRTQSVYDKLRWLDENGKEVVRVDYAEGQARVIPADQLQNKSQRYFFADAMRLQAGQVYVSPLDLNVELDQLDVPYRPTLRVAMPISNTAARKRGIVILNYHAQTMLQAFVKGTNSMANRAMLLNSDGYWLKGQAPADEWGFMLQHPELSLAARAPDTWRLIRDQDHGQVTQADGLWTWQTLYPLAQGQSSSTGATDILAASEGRVDASLYAWKSVAHMPSAMLSGVLLAVWLKLVAVALALAGLLGFGSWKLTLARFRQAQAEDKLRGVNAHLEQLVTERTRALENANQELRLSEENLAITLHSIGDAVIATDAAGRVKRMNAAAEQLSGWTLVEADGRALTEVFRIVDARTRQPMADPVQLVMKKGQTVELAQHTLLLARDGSEYHVADSAAPIRNNAGTIVGVVLVFSDISEKHQTQAALRESEERYRTAFVTSPDAININRLSDGLYIDVNDGFMRLTGWKREQVIGKTSKEIQIWQDPLDRELLVQTLSRDGYCSNLEANFRRQDGRTVVGLMSAHTITVKGDPCIMSVTRDITERRSYEENLQLAASVFTHAREGIMITRADGTILDINESFCRITGYGRDEVLGQNPRLFKSKRHNHEFYRKLWQDLNELGQWNGEIWNKRKTGEIYPLSQTISSVRNPEGKTHAYVSLFSDISAQKAQQGELERLAHFDALTGLPNRVLLADRLHQAMVQAQRRSQTLAVAYIDLDGFKAVNDQQGHQAGDQLLTIVASRMKQAMREGDTLARLGGDEFAAVLIDLTEVASCIPLLNRLLAASAQAVQVNNCTLQVSASIGVTFYPQMQNIDADQLLRQADQAMYQAKLAGKNRFHFFDTEKDISIRDQHESLERIRLALSQSEFVLHYQPKVNLRTGAVIGVEALIRWQHPELGLLPPARFLPMIEDHPLSIEVGEWVIDQALFQLEAWQTAGLTMPISVNVAAHQLQHTSFVVRLNQLLERHPQVPAHLLELEILETSALDDLKHVSRVIETCRSLGVSFSLDDFGTGYSSLTYLKHLGVALLKIDRSFVRDMLDDREDLAILEGVVGLANAFHCKVLAEGVETILHGTLLLQLGCDLAQGFCIAKPMPAAALPDWLAHWKPDPAWSNVPRISHDNLPLLRATVEYRSWISGVEAYLSGEREAPPPMDPQRFRFGQWLDSEGIQHHGTQPGWETIQTMHRRAQALAQELIALQTQGRGPEAAAQMEELQELRDGMLGQLNAIGLDSRPGDLLI
jgi:diguanylate cyclase (GGDEF)-like protein/PAS domain S-box-containing protein